MPTYDYLCDGCGHKFEERQTFAAALLTVCPKCGESRLRRLFGTGAAILFKGTGFYETDYRSESYKSAAGSDVAAKPAETAAPSAPTTTPAAPAASTPTPPSSPKCG